MKGELVSIIVPVYNAAETIGYCLDSICAQTYRDIEILAIDDGSTDKSREIIEQYAAKDRRVRPIFKENSGVAQSRNLGMELARGTYLQFADSDDWISPVATERFVQAITRDGTQMAISDYYRVTGKKFYKRSSIKTPGVYTLDDFAQEMMKAPANFYYGVMWNKFYVTAIVRKYGLRCQPGMDWCEDFLFNLEYLRHVRKVSVIKKALYYYRKRKGSLVSTQVTPSNVLHTKKHLFSYYKELYESIDLYEEHKLTIQKFYVSTAHEVGEKVKMGVALWEMEPDNARNETKWELTKKDE